MSLFGKLLGTGDVIEKGLDLIDKKFPSDIDVLEAKTKAKVDLMESYQGFKVAQRYLAILFSTSFILCFFLVLGRALFGFDNDVVLQTVDQFSIDVITMIIVSFYFAGGAVEGVIGRVKNRKAS